MILPMEVAMGQVRTYYAIKGTQGGVREFPLKGERDAWVRKHEGAGAKALAADDYRVVRYLRAKERGEKLTAAALHKPKQEPAPKEETYAQRLGKLAAMIDEINSRGDQ